MNVGFLPLYCVLSVYSTILNFTLNLFIFTIISDFYYSLGSSFCSSLIIESFPFFESLFSSLASLFLLEFFLFFWVSCSIIFISICISMYLSKIFVLLQQHYKRLSFCRHVPLFLLFCYFC
jgi:hypothetical protein